MGRKAVFVNGYGSIGRRVAAFLAEDPQIRVVGVGKQSPGAGVAEAASRGFAVYVPEDRAGRFAGADGVAGTIREAVRDCDLVVDASPGGKGSENKARLYGPAGVAAIYQGGEAVHGEGAVSDLLFNSRSNYAEAAGGGRRHVMVGSCNVTGMGRALQPLRDRYGGRLARFDVTLVRRWADAEQEKEVEDTIEMAASPHHGRDVEAFMGRAVPLFLRAVKVPTRQMHLHIMDVRFSGEAPPAAEFLETYRDEPGVATLWTATGTAEVRRFADSMGFSFADTGLIHVHANMTSSAGDTVRTMYSDDQTGIVIPENHMLAQAMLFGRPYAEAAERTSSLFRAAEKKRMLEERFAPGPGAGA